MKCGLYESIEKLKEEREKTLDEVRLTYATALSKLIEQCDHKDDKGINALIPANKPFHSGWDVCKICGK